MGNGNYLGRALLQGRALDASTMEYVTCRYHFLTEGCVRPGTHVELLFAAGDSRTKRAPGCGIASAAASSLRRHGDLMAGHFCMLEPVCRRAPWVRRHPIFHAPTTLRKPHSARLDRSQAHGNARAPGTSDAYRPPSRAIRGYVGVDLRMSDARRYHSPAGSVPSLPQTAG